ncbi:iron ABC transporter permease [Vibrio sp.]|nr:iron ABC transporter permease [Vibrio sp.]
MLVAIVAATAIFSLFVGASDLSFTQVIETLVFGGQQDFIINEYRLPRIVLAIGVGAGPVSVFRCVVPSVLWDYSRPILRECYLAITINYWCQLRHY